MKSSSSYSLYSLVWIALGTFIAAFALEIILLPNHLIDGGIVGIAMILGALFGKPLIPYLIILFNTPFVFLAYRLIGKTLVINLVFANLCFFLSLLFFESQSGWFFQGEILEVVVIGGALLGIGGGLIIRAGGCVDGTEILAIVLNKYLSITVGQTILICNIFVFAIYGIALSDWHPALLSLIMYIVVVKVMDPVIVGFDETKLVMIISQRSETIASAIVHTLGLGLTVIPAKGGFSGKGCDLLYVITERLQLAELKELVLKEDPKTFMAIIDLHEVANGRQGEHASLHYKLKALAQKALFPHG